MGELWESWREREREWISVPAEADHKVNRTSCDSVQ